MGEPTKIDAPINQSTAHPARANGFASAFTRFVCATYLQLSGWKVRGDWPGLDKAVLVAAPHTSNWDGLNMLATAGFYRVKLRWMGKKSLTQGPFGWLIKWLGCVPIDRSGANDVVRAMADAGVDAILVGESLIVQEDRAAAVRALTGVEKSPRG